MIAVVRVAVLIRKNFFNLYVWCKLINCMVGGGICGIVSGDDVRHGCTGSSLVHHHHH